MIYFLIINFSLQCLRLDSNQHILMKPPPQDGVSTNFTTQAKNYKNPVIFFACDPAGIRTQDPYIKSVLLYQLSYRVGHFANDLYLNNIPRFQWCKDMRFFVISKLFCKFV